jgi:hypothetical protein
MLDLQDESKSSRVVDAIRKLECEIELPPSWADFFDQSGLVPSEEAERRKSARWKTRALAGLHHRQSFPAIPRSERWYQVYLKDISREGAAFLHAKQLFPRERMRLLFIDDVSKKLLHNECLLTIEVVRCRFIHRNCFEIGAMFVPQGYELD